MIETYRCYNCTNHSEDISPWFGNNSKENLYVIVQWSCSLLQTILYRSYRTLCCCSVVKGRTSDRDRPGVWCYQFVDDIHRKFFLKYPQYIRNAMRLFYNFGNYMEYISLCDVLVDHVMLNYVFWFTVKVRKLVDGHIHNLLLFQC
jgi:hypothetical protein